MLSIIFLSTMDKLIIRTKEDMGVRSIEEAIQAMIDEKVAAAEQRILESLNVQSDMKLTFSEACDYLGMSEYTLRKLCRSKRIPHRTVGEEGSKCPRYLFSTKSLDQWMKAQEAANYKSSGMMSSP